MSFFKNHGSQIKTVIVIVHTPITPLFKPAQLMPFEYWFYCAVLQHSVQCGKFFMHCAHYVAKLKQVCVFICSFFSQKGKKETKNSVILLQIMLRTIRSVEVCSICLRKLLVKFEKMKKNAKQKAYSVGNVS